MECIPAFCAECSCIAAPPRKKINKGKWRKLDSLQHEEHDALATMQDILVSVPVLVVPLSKGHLILDADRVINKQVVSCWKNKCTWQKSDPAIGRGRWMWQGRATVYQFMASGFLVFSFGCSVITPKFGGSQVHHLYGSRCLDMTPWFFRRHWQIGALATLLIGNEIPCRA